MSTFHVIPFDSKGNLPAYVTDTEWVDELNKEVASATGFPVMSIRGKVFTAVVDGVRTVLTKPDEPEEVAQFIGVSILRANMNAKTYYAGAYTGEDSVGTPPDCYSMDGIAPSPHAQNPQSDKCATCLHNQWGSRIGEDGVGKGKACSDNARLAISTPDEINPMLLRVPPASLKALKDALAVVKSRKLPYNAVIMRIGFDREAASPKLTFKPIGLVSDETYEAIRAEYEGDTVRAIVGLDDHESAPAALPAPTAVSADELDAALAARAGKDETPITEDDLPVYEEPEVKKAPAKKAAAKKAPAKKAAAPAPAPAPAEDEDDAASDLLADLDALLASTDD